MVKCKRCDKEVEHLSKKGLCQECSGKAMLEAARQMHEKKGPIYDLQQARLKAAKEVTHADIPI